MYTFKCNTIPTFLFFYIYNFQNSFCFYVLSDFLFFFLNFSQKKYNILIWRRLEFTY